MIRRLISLYQEHGIFVRSTVPEGDILPRPETDNRELLQGDCFIAIKGENFDGHSFINQAMAQGAEFCIGETEQAQIVVTDSRKAAALYAKLYFNDPSANMKLFGITGTNGKTTSSLMLYQMLVAQGINAAWIGTLGYKMMGKDYQTKHTTPDILQLNSIFAEMYSQGVSHVVMEVSSHALALDRVYGVEFDFCLYTNLSRDHLDFHRDMDEYFETKFLLFERVMRSAGKCVVNGDDLHGQLIVDRVLAEGGECLVVGRKPGSSMRIADKKITQNGSDFSLILDDREECIIHSPLVGDFNIDNLALACGALLQAGTSMQSLPGLCAGLKAVPGRIESVANSHGIGVYIDYAHSPDALDNLLRSIRKLPHTRIITVFGAGGNRDMGKRPLMLKAALSHSDIVIITDDNPRDESPEKIIYDIVKDSDWNLPWWVIRDRAQAIRAAIQLAMPGDIVLICGKGHETYQEIEGVRHDYDDHQAARQALDTLCRDKAEDELILGIDPLILKLLLGNIPLDESYQSPRYYSYLSTDSRHIKAASLFIALKGENFDGNRFVPKVIEDPSAMAVASDPNCKHPRVYISEDPESVMADLLRKYLQMFAIYKIGITGSTGKTSSKELIAKVLSSRTEVLKTAKNENNIVGLCKTILRVEPRHKFGVFEIGTNHFGEIARLSNTLTPDAGIILNIGPSHLEFFGDENGVFSEKSELFNRPLDIRLYPADDPRFEAYRELGFGIGFGKESDFMISEMEIGNQSMSFRLNDTKWTLPYNARHFALNSAFAIVLAKHLGYEPAEIQAALSETIALDMRMQVVQSKSHTIIIDCYNANPVSMQAAIEYWHQFMPEKPHAAFLGEMLELGESAELYHQMIGAILFETGEKHIFSVGNHARSYQGEPENHFPDVEALLKSFPALPADSVVLVKASHSIHLEKILPRLRGEL